MGLCAELCAKHGGNDGDGIHRDVRYVLHERRLWVFFESAGSGSGGSLSHLVGHVKAVLGLLVNGYLTSIVMRDMTIVNMMSHSC